MFGGMENCLYLCSVDKNNIIMNASVVNSIREYFKTKPVEKAWVFGFFSLVSTLKERFGLTGVGAAMATAGLP